MRAGFDLYILFMAAEIGSETPPIEVLGCTGKLQQLLLSICPFQLCLLTSSSSNLITNHPSTPQNVIHSIVPPLPNHPTHVILCILSPRQSYTQPLSDLFGTEKKGLHTYPYHLRYRLVRGHLSIFRSRSARLCQWLSLRNNHTNSSRNIQHGQHRASTPRVRPRSTWITSSKTSGSQVGVAAALTKNFAVTWASPRP